MRTKYSCLTALPLWLSRRRLHRLGLGARSERHEFRVDWIGDRLAQHVIDFRPRSRAERLPENLVDWRQLAGVARPPQSRSCALIESPAHGQMNDTLPIARLCELIETTNRSKVLRVARRPEFRVGPAEIVAAKMRVFLQLAGQQTAAQCAVGQCRKIRFPAIAEGRGLRGRNSPPEGWLLVGERVGFDIPEGRPRPVTT